MEKIFELLKEVSQRTGKRVVITIHMDGSGHFDDYQGYPVGPSFQDIRDVNLVTPTQGGIFENGAKLF